MKKKMSLEEWAVGGRNFGRWLSWFVLAGEIYTAFAFLGASGWAYNRGAPTFYMIGYGAIGLCGWLLRIAKNISPWQKVWSNDSAGFS